MNKFNLKRVGLLLKSDFKIFYKSMLAVLLTIVVIQTVFVLIFTERLDDTLAILFCVGGAALFCLCVSWMVHRKVFNNVGLRDQLLPASNIEKFLSYFVEMFLLLLVYILLFYVVNFILNIVHSDLVAKLLDSEQSIKGKKILVVGNMIFIDIISLFFNSVFTLPAMSIVVLCFLYSAVKIRKAPLLFAALFVVLSFYTILILMAIIFPLMNNMSGWAPLGIFGDGVSRVFVSVKYDAHPDDLVFLSRVKSLVIICTYITVLVFAISTYFAYKEKEIK